MTRDELLDELKDRHRVCPTGAGRLELHALTKWIKAHWGFYPPTPPISNGFLAPLQQRVKEIEDALGRIEPRLAVVERNNHYLHQED